MVFSSLKRICMSQWHILGWPSLGPTSLTVILFHLILFLNSVQWRQLFFVQKRRVAVPWLSWWLFFFRLCEFWWICLPMKPLPRSGYRIFPSFQRAFSALVLPMSRQPITCSPSWWLLEWSSRVTSSCKSQSSFQNYKFHSRVVTGPLCSSNCIFLSSQLEKVLGISGFSNLGMIRGLECSRYSHNQPLQSPEGCEPQWDMALPLSS